MSSTKSSDALDSLESDLRGRLDEEVRTLEAYRGRLEREARVDAELARIDDAIARRIGSIPPPAAPSYRPASYAPASLLSSPPPAFPSWNPPTSVLPPASVAPAPVSQPLPYAYQTSRMVTLATISAMLAVVVSLTVLVISAGDRFVPTASAAERPMMSVVAAAPAPAAPAAGASCSDKSDANAKKIEEAKPSATPEPAVVAKPLGPVAPVERVAAPVNVVRRSASRSSVASKPAAPSPAAEAAAPAAAAPAAAPAATNMDDAARTAQMLREQLGASLK